MRTLFDIFMVWPMPALWVLLPGLILLRHRSGRRLVLVGGILLLVGTTPIVGNALLGSLERGAREFRSGAASSNGFDAIVVPLAGAYEDPAGRWWPMPGSVTRTVRGQQLHAETGYRLLVIGGTPLPGQRVPEAIALQRVITLSPDTVVEDTARDTFETARAVSALVKAPDGANRPPRVIIVTSGSHVTRMAAALRRFGIDVAAAPPRRYEDARIARNLWLDLVPSARGARSVRRAMHEYVGISWYLATGRIRLRDL
ncbi:MAG: YdcF family protein [Rhodospirillaceae bacterium]|nr:YdcF family protein [Rhodospirillaceae bacterium]MBT5946007.1 YdcF family protein [Rhodospirillaceae bacterium]MBT6405283.1 YdcF family protein [Rhodospirillaceae bacterium]MBT6535532.1 YdcF family protein [Rhodospirillaceae bacterium]MBT7360566.1 YdcF family protein [Rhodospirillaceae bacterium]